MPSLVSSKSTPEALRASVSVPEVLPRTCKLDGYSPIKVPAFKASGRIVAYASPDSTFAVTKRMIDGAKKSILIGIYDFSADHVKKLVLQAMRRGVKVQLMLDIDSAMEQELFRELERFGADCTPAPSCASKRAHVFRSSHEKVIIIDDQWALVQSGNFSDNSVPLNVKDGGDPNDFSTGNRDAGIAVESRPIAAFFRKVLESDIALELQGLEAAAALEAVADSFLVERAPTKLPVKRFPSSTFQLSSHLKIQPVLSPDNYMAVVPAFLRSAKKSIHIQQQYIRASQSHIKTLLEAIATARKVNPKLDVRILLGKIFSKKDLPKENANLEELRKSCDLKLGTHIRYVDTTRFVHCHNKMILIDGSGVLISSQNWSNAAVSENREAGLLFEHQGIRNYFAGIFESDWSTAAKSPSIDQPEALEPEALRTGGYVRVRAGDYAEV